MATVTFIPEAKQSVSAMRGLINYCLQDFKVRDEQSGRRLVGGVNCNGENAYTEFMTTKNSYGKTTGMNFYQYVQSFSPREDVTPERAHQIGLEFVQKAWPGHEVLVTTHSDAEHIHSHFVINSVSFENGYKLRQNPQSLIKLRALSDEICKAYGLSTLAAYKGGGSKVSSREYRAAVKGESWKFRLMSDIDSAMNKSGSKQDFISEMKRKGYEITWTNERKYITFSCPNGRKCRDKTLHDEKYLKETIEYELQFREQHCKNRKQFGGEPYQEKRARDSRDAHRRSARYGSDSGKGLGYDGEPVTVGGRFSADGLRTDENPSDRIKNENDDGTVVGNGTEKIRHAIKEMESKLNTQQTAVENILHQMKNHEQRVGSHLEKVMNDTLVQGKELEKAIAKAQQKTDRRTWLIRTAISVGASLLAAVLSTLLCVLWLA